MNPGHAFETNSEGTKNLAEICAKRNIPMLYMSSVGTFNGKKKGTYNEEDLQQPINVYGESKLLGEQYVRKLLTKYFIVRAGWMIGGMEKDKKFVAKILRLIRRGVRTLDVVIDKKGTPTYTVDLSEIIARLIKSDFYGTYHAATLGEPTRFDIARRILEQLKRTDIELNPVNSEKLKKLWFAPRPDNETIDSSKIQKLFPGIIKPWQERFDEYLLSSTGFSMAEDASKFSIVICFWVDVPRFYEDIKKFEKLKYKNFELIVISDKEITLPRLSLPIKLVLTGKKRTGVGEKRDFALKVAKGDFIAYIDDDAYPHPEWLSNALFDFKDPRVGAVGGPNLTPPEDSFWAKISGNIYESYLTSGGAQNRFVPKQKMTVSELQGVNLIIRKDILLKVGGFSTKLFSGDDTRICHSIRLLGYEVIYDPKVKVFHHRREFPLGHLRQIRTMGTHRGYFVKKYPETSQYPIYFLPSLFLIYFVVLAIGALAFNLIKILLLVSFLGVLMLGFFSVVKRSGFIMAVLTAFGIFLTHLVYGFFFLKGLFFVKDLENN
jgi:dTDP-4-dehydrorhamnose reductase